MSDKTEAPDRMVVALAAERATYIRARRPDRIAMLDEQLAHRGWCVNDQTGELVALADTRPKTDKPPAKAAREKAPERADAKAPENTAEPKA